MEKVAIVVLNYLNYTDTFECVESIAIDEYPDKQIIIVDNGSPNESQDRLVERFEHMSGVHLVFNNTNEGFARGNNLGIRYATDILGCSFVLLVNNDTVFQDPHMIKTLMEAYEPGVGVIAPRIIDLDGNEQNPMSQHYIIRSKPMQDWYYMRRIAKLTFKRTRFYQLLRKLNIFTKLKKTKVKQIPCQTINSLNMVLQGSCWLLSKDYFTYYPYLFPDTFLYYEETILTILTYKVGLTKKLVHTTHILHKEQMSSEMGYNNDKRIRTGFYLDGTKIAKQIYSLPYETLIDRYFHRTKVDKQ